MRKRNSGVVPSGRNRVLSGFVPVLASACIVAACLAGCRPAGPERVPVSGSVSFNGVPIEDGRICFYPSKETGGGPMSGAYIVNGKYEVNQKGGVPVGTNKVKFYAYRSSSASNKTMDVGGLDLPSQGPQYLPPKFNTNSELELTIESGSGPVTKDFDLRP